MPEAHPLWTWEQWNDLHSRDRMVCSFDGLQHVEHRPFVGKCERGIELTRLIRRRDA